MSLFSFVPGFDMMEVFGLVEKEYSSIKGVAMEPFVFSGSRTFTLFRDIQLTQRTRWEQSSAVAILILSLMPCARQRKVILGRNGAALQATSKWNDKYDELNQIIGSLEKEPEGFYLMY